MRKALVLGGAGFVGSALSRRLVESGEFEITVIDKFVFGNGLAGFTSDHLLVVDGDVSDVDVVSDTLEQEKFDVVFHLAANSDIRASVENPAIDLVNTFGTSSALALALAKANYFVPRIVFSSTSAIFGSHTGPIDKDAVQRPESAYGWMKLASEHNLRQLEDCGLIGSLRIIRFPNVTGLGQTHGVVKDLCAKAAEAEAELEVLGNGSQTKPYVHVQELVTAIIAFADKAYDGPSQVNLAPSDQVSVREIAELVVASSKKALEIRFQDSVGGWPGDVPNYSYDLSDLPPSLASSLTMSSLEAVRRSINEEFEKLHAE